MISADFLETLKLISFISSNSVWVHSLPPKWKCFSRIPGMCHSTFHTTILMLVRTPTNVSRCLQICWTQVPRDEARANDPSEIWRQTIQSCAAFYAFAAVHGSWKATHLSRMPRSCLVLWLEGRIQHLRPGAVRNNQGSRMVAGWRLRTNNAPSGSIADPTSNSNRSKQQRVPVQAS